MAGERLSQALLVVCACLSVAQASRLHRGRVLNAYPAIAGDTCEIETVEFPNFNVINVFTQGLALLPSEKLSTLGVSNECLMLTTLNSPLIACLGDLSVQEGCCSEVCYYSLKDTVDNPQTAKCLTQLMTASCVLSGTADAVQVRTLAPLQTSLFSVMRRCVVGDGLSCESLLSPPKPSPAPSPPPALSPSPPPPFPSPSPPPSPSPSPSPSPTPNTFPPPPYGGGRPFAPPPPYGPVYPPHFHGPTYPPPPYGRNV